MVKDFTVTTTFCQNYNFLDFVYLKYVLKLNIISFGKKKKKIQPASCFSF